MNRNSLTILASSLVLVATLACGGGGGSSTPAMVTPAISAPAYIGIGQTANVTTQSQSNCTYTWTVSGDAATTIASGQGTSSITLTTANTATTSH